MIKLKDLVVNESPSKVVTPVTINEFDKKTMGRASKLLTYLVKYYGLKIDSARQAVSDLARFL